MTFGRDRSNLIPTPVKRQLVNVLALHRDGTTRLSPADHLRLCVLLLQLATGRRIDEILASPRCTGPLGPLKRLPAADGAEALSYLKRFGSVTVLNGHIHQVLQKVEGNVTFHTAMSTAFPQPEPGKAPNPGPLKVPAEKLRSMLGLTSVQYKQGKSALAVVDSNLS